ncbi:MAG: type II secretion system protein GspM, partial [Erysipelotrichaceae bacterium]|nr:type II secretion system protein GspM [Erysipelotrichaceae bacterium]
MRTISKRETFLLFIMGMIAIVGILYMLVIKPLMAEIAENRQILSDAESKQTMIMATLPNIDSLRNKLDKRFEEVSTALNEIEQPINEAEFERWVLPLTTKYNMR